MIDRFEQLEQRWNWRLSAHLRIASLVSLWLVLLFTGPLGWMFAPIAAARSGLSFLQAFLNVRLGREVPLEGQTRLDWALVVLIFVAAYIAVGLGRVVGNMHSPFLFVPLLVPFSVLQSRMTLRSFRAARIEASRPATLIRLDDYRRGEREELRAA